MKTSISIILFLGVQIALLAQETVITRSYPPLGIQVRDTLSNQLLDIASLCDGFDEEGIPINMVIPEYAITTVFIPYPADEALNKFWSLNMFEDLSLTYDHTGRLMASDTPPKLSSISRHDFVYNGDSVMVVDNRPLYGSMRKHIHVVALGRDSKGNAAFSDTTHFMYQRERSMTRILEVFLASEMLELMKAADNRGVMDIAARRAPSIYEMELTATRKYDNWVAKGYVDSVSPSELPRSPRFPYDEKNLILRLSYTRSGLHVTLEKDGKSQILEDPFVMGNVIQLSNLTSGHYKLTIEDREKKYGIKEVTYDFIIERSFWQQGGYWLLILIPLLVLLLLIYRGYARAKVKRLSLMAQLSEAELTAIRSQLNPHFLFNALNAIQNLVNKNEAERANNYIVKLSKLMRLVLNQSEEHYHPLQQELEIAQLYIELEQLRTPFRFNLESDEALDHNLLVPAMILQPYLENAVIHGVIHKNATFISLTVRQTEKSCQFKISDNGQGKSSHKGSNKGLKIGADRLHIISEQLSIETRIETKETAHGFDVMIEIPTNL